ncbi:MAG: hypothetical protein QXI02_04140 [Candidatus Caldarchaeum sp.]
MAKTKPFVVSARETDLGQEFKAELQVPDSIYDKIEAWGAEAVNNLVEVHLRAIYAHKARVFMVRNLSDLEIKKALQEWRPTAPSERPRKITEEMIRREKDPVKRKALYEAYLAQIERLLEDFS